MWALLSLSAALGLLPQLPVDPIIIASTNPATFTLQDLVFDAVPGATDYRIYVTPIVSNSVVVVGAYTVSRTIVQNALAVGSLATNFSTGSKTTNSIPHLLYGANYLIQAQAIQDTNASSLNSGIMWPQTLTNFGLHTYQQSSDLIHWESVGPVSVVTNPAGFFRISQTKTNNRDAFQVRE